ncbi:MAG: hypothetical protein KC415_02435 [Anaerolineales bacterium]|nr:hypothetical protein [Anaerolineales bacterium]MCB8992009.1 DNA translocase FtsK [Ardenticatenaceae bacterium]MCB9004593.1 DNA translocase FtsK [Ardenticatenaceae bacterium]
MNCVGRPFNGRPFFTSILERLFAFGVIMEGQARHQQVVQQQRLQHQLEIQSMQIERVFDEHQVPAQVSGGTVHPRSIRFELQTQVVQGLERLKALKDELVSSLGGVAVQVEQENGRFNLEVSRDEDVPVPLLELLPLLPDLPPITAVLGLAEDDRPVLLNLTEEDMTHVLVAGDSGAGKTELLRATAVSLAMNNRQSQLQMLILHPGGDGTGLDRLEPLNYLPHMLSRVIVSPEETEQVLHFLVNEMTYRREQSIASPTIVIFVDRIVRVLENGEVSVRHAMTRLLQHGADAGIHLIMATSRPEAKSLATWLKGDVPVRLVGQVADEEQSRIAAGTSSVHAEYLLGHGDFMAVGNGEVIRFQAAFMGDYDLHLCLEDLHRRRPPALLAREVSTRPHINMENDLPANKPVQPFVYNGKGISIESHLLHDASQREQGDAFLEDEI